MIKRQITLKLFWWGIFLTFALGMVDIGTAATMGYSVKPVIPQNQTKEGLKYFDLILKPGEEQTLQVEISNETQRPLKIEITPTSAVTNIAGMVDYAPTKIAADESLKYNIKDYIQVPKLVTLKPLSRQKVEVKVRMPEVLFDGIVAGGLNFYEQGQNKSSSKEKKSGISVENAYSYTIALLMQQNLKPLEPQLKLKKLQAGQVNGRNVINAHLQNDAMTYLNTMAIAATVTGISNKKLSYNFSNLMMQMAPNSSFDLPIPVSIQNAATRISEPIEPGKYRLHMVVHGQKDKQGKYSREIDGKTERYKYQWTFDKEFTIADEQARKLNESDPTVKRNSSWLWWIFALILFLILILLFFILFWKRRKKDEKQEETDELRNKVREQEELIQKLSDETKDEKT